MKDIQTEVECINLRIALLNEESVNLYKLLDNFQLMEDNSLDDIRLAVLRQLDKRKKEMKKELTSLSLRVKQLGKDQIR